MLSEIEDVRQITGEPHRRWFCDSEFDLIVWLFPDSSPMGFQLCYHDGMDEKALTWTTDHGYTHNRVDDGENRPARPKMTPILVPDGVFHRDHVLDVLIPASAEVEPAIRDFVVGKLRAMA